MIVLILAVVMTLLAVFFWIEVGKENRTAAAELVISKAWNNRFSRQDIEEKKEVFLKENAKYHTVSDKKAAKKVKEWDKQIADYQKAEEAYLSGRKFSLVDGISLFGYQFLVDLKINADNDMFRKMIDSCEHSGYIELERGQETGGRKNSFIYAYYIIASLFSYAFLGVFLAIFLALVTLAMGREMSNVLMFAVVGFAGMLLLGYIPYDGLHAKAKKRQEAIDRDFPNVISKIALLVTAGMNIVKAMDETANSDETTMYLELQKTMKEINQSVSVEAALIHLQCRCNNKYLDKMITIVSKSYVAGNANLADNLRAINAECWLDKKHNARRMGEVVQSKLFIPTMLMFVGILIVIIIPAMSGFSF
ncbi:MAG: type II secretion system F family protein [Lachnospiraceae bacterium]|nr:type II secretion system F family protein [Lachnospiraceae bacterium]